MDRLDAMAAFVAVCEAEGFAAGGRRLGLSASATSRMIGALEARLGVRLLHRTTRSLGLTEAGRRYLERARQILVEVGEAEESARRDRATPRGRLVVSAPIMFGRLHVAPLLRRYMARHPEVAVELLLNDRVVNLVEEGVDVAIRIGELADSTLVARRLGETRRVVVASPRYLRRRGRPRRPEQMAGHDVVLFSALNAPPEWRFERGGQETRVRLAPRFITNSADAAIAHVIEDGGLTRTLAYQVVDAVRGGQLEIVLADYEAPPVPISAVYPSSRLLSAKVRSFVDLAAHDAHWQFVAIGEAASRYATAPSAT